MKIIVLHGDDINRLSIRLSSFVGECQKRGWEVLRDHKDSMALKEALRSKDLFSSDKIVICDDLKMIDKKFLSWLDSSAKDLPATLIICSAKTLTSTFLKSLPKGTVVENFELPKIIWKYLDSLIPGNADNSLRLLHELLETQASDFVFYMLTRHFRDLFWVISDEKNCPYQGWRLSKLKTQASKFGISNLQDIIENMAQIDIRCKTSKSNLKDELDLLFALKLQ
jgi:hypothetical protein